MGSNAAHHVLGFYHLEREGEKKAKNPSNSSSGLLTNGTASPPFNFTQGVAVCSQAILALHLPTQSKSYLLPSHTVPPAADASATGRKASQPPSSTVDGKQWRKGHGFSKAG